MKNNEMKVRMYDLPLEKKIEMLNEYLIDRKSGESLMEMDEVEHCFHNHQEAMIAAYEGVRFGGGVFNPKDRFFCFGGFSDTIISVGEEQVDDYLSYFTDELCEWPYLEDYIGEEETQTLSGFINDVLINTSLTVHFQEEEEE